MDDGHGHAHGLGGQSHGVSAHTDLRWLTVALAINALFMLVEVAVGVIASSLAVLSDAAHMLTDAGAIGLALFAARLARRRPKGAMTYGLGRAEILSAQANGLTLLILACFIVYEAVRRLVHPPTVEASLVLAIGLAGFAVNLAAALALARANRESLNVEGAFQHNLIDAYASVGTAVAAVVILITGFQRADPIASLLIAVPMLRSGYTLVKASGRIFLEAAPEGVDPEQVGRAMAAVPGVCEVHDLHVWEVTSGFPALSAHVLVPAGSDCHAKRRELDRLLHDRFGIEHTTLQVEHEDGELLRIETPGR
ncbi:MAG: cation diffusion facilitator family transporter [Solirubrobacteraceae bacterium]